MKFFFVLPLTLFLLSCQTETARTQKPKLGTILEDQSDMKIVRQKLEACVDEECPATEKPLATEWLQIVNELEEKNANPSLTSTKLLDLTVRTIDLYESQGNKDFAIKLWSQAFSVMTMMDTKTFGEEKLAKLKTRFLDLPENYNDKETAWWIRSMLLSREHDLPGALKAAYDCKKAVMHSPACQGLYDAFTKQLEEPYCNPSEIKGKFAFYFGDLKPGTNFPHKLKGARGTYYAESTPRITNADIARITGANAQVMGLISTAEGKAKLAEVTSQLGRILLVTYNDEVLMAPRINEQISNGHLQIFQGTDSKSSLFQKVCPKPRLDKVPAELKL